MIFLSIALFYTDCNKPIPVQKPVQEKENISKRISLETGKVILERDNKLIEKAIKSNYKNQSFKKTKLHFWINSEIDEVEKNKMGDKVVYTYQIEDLNGEIIYDSLEIGKKTLYLEKQNEIRGIEYALKIMNKNEESLLLLPSILAYAGYGDGKKILPNLPIVVKLKLFSINK